MATPSMLKPPRPLAVRARRHRTATGTGTTPQIDVPIWGGKDYVRGAFLLLYDSISICIYIYISLFSRIHIHIQYTIYNINIYIIYIYILCIHVSLFLVSLFWLGIQPTWLYGTDTMLQRASGTRLKRLVGLVVCSPWQSW